MNHLDIDETNKTQSIGKDDFTDRGLLDLAVALSTRDITAGKQFTVFVIIKNPFNKQAWMRQVDVSLPSELKIAEKNYSLLYRLASLFKVNQPQLPREDNKEQEQAYLHDFRKLRGNIEDLKTLIDKAESSPEALTTNTDSLRDTSDNILRKIDSIEAKALHKPKISATNIQMNDGISSGDINTTHEVTNIQLTDKVSAGDIKVFSSVANLQVEGNASIGRIEVHDKTAIEKEQLKSGKISLSGSLPENKALQPGCTTVYTAVLDVNRPFLFTPSQYRLQFNVQYSFNKKPEVTSGKDINEDRIFSNTVSHELAIRPSVGSMIFGGAVGGAIGSVSRVLQVNPANEIQQFKGIDYYTSGVSVLLAVILSCIAIIFMARKSDAQSFISVEDFWGGLLIGFLVGYTGTSFFQELTGFSPDMQPNNGSPELTSPSLSEEE